MLLAFDTTSIPTTAINTPNTKTININTIATVVGVSVGFAVFRARLVRQWA